MEVTPSIYGFSFDKDVASFDDLTFIGTTAANLGDDLDADDWGVTGNTGDVTMTQHGVAEQQEEDFFTGDQAIGDDFGGDFGGDFGDTGMGMSMDDTAMQAMDEDAEGVPNAPAGAGVPQAFDPRRAPNERELVMAMADDEGDAMMDYFDRTFLKNWAGPDHWKLRKVVRKGYCFHFNVP